MNLNDDQKTAHESFRQGKGEANAIAIPLLGLIGKIGAIATAYREQLSDGGTEQPPDGRANPAFKTRLREELGDALRYIVTVADQAGLELAGTEAAHQREIADHWRPVAVDRLPFDEACPPDEQLPRTAKFVLRLSEMNGVTTSSLTWNGQAVGDPLTGTLIKHDGYLLHDVFHLSYLAVLGWSPVMRNLLHRRRRSDPRMETEDGSVAIDIEEGISAMIFAYATVHNFFEGASHIDDGFLDVVTSTVGHLEVGAHDATNWEKAILTGYAAWRELSRLNGGVIDVDMATQSLTVSPLPAPAVSIPL